MAADQGPVVQSALLRSEMVRIRKEKGLTQEQVANDLEWSPSKLIRIEGGRNSITKVDLDALLSKYGITSESQRERLQVLNRGARENGWWNRYRGEIGDTYLNYVGYEAGAAFVRQFQSSVVPGLLQTREYATALTEAFTITASVSSVVDLRLQRQKHLADRSEPPRQYFVVDEAVIRRRVGIDKDPAIMPKQLRYIADLAENSDRITFRVIPFGAGAHAGLPGAFTLLEFEGGLSDILYLDAGRTLLVMVGGDDRRIADYADNFESMVEQALPAESSVELLRKVAEEMS
jgi:transcriptional regulator with XRE-family HTH domain